MSAPRNGLGSLTISSTSASIPGTLTKCVRKPILFRDAPKSGRIGLQRQRRPGSYQQARNLQRLGHKWQNLPAERPAVVADEQENSGISGSVPCQKRRRYASTDAANSAVAVYFVLTRIHDAQITLRVDDLSAQGNGT